MNVKRIAYRTALAVTGLGALGLKLWAVATWSGSRGSWNGWGFHHVGAGGPPPWGFGLPLLAVLLVAAVAVWYRRKGLPHGPMANPWESLGLEYVEGRITRDEFLARRATLEE